MGKVAVMPNRVNMDSNPKEGMDNRKLRMGSSLILTDSNRRQATGNSRIPMQRHLHTEHRHPTVKVAGMGMDMAPVWPKPMPGNVFWLF